MTKGTGFDLKPPLFNWILLVKRYI